MAVLVFAGDDPFSVGRALAAVIEKGSFEPFDIERIDASSTPLPAVYMTVGTAGLFASHRLVIIQGLGLDKRERARTSKSKTESEENAFRWEDLLKACPDTTTAVAVLAGLRADSKLLKEATKLGKEGKLNFRQFPAPKAKDMAGWLLQHAKSSGYRLDPKAAQQLAIRVGDQVMLAGTELEKLATAAGSDGTITPALVEQLVAKTSEESIFPLIDAIAAQQPAKAFQLLSGQLDQLHGGEEGLSLPMIRLVARQLRILLSVKTLSAQGSKRAEIIATLKLSEYFADRYFSQAARLSQAQLAGAIERLVVTEQGIKNGDAGPAALQLLIADLTRTGPSPAQR